MVGFCSSMVRPITAGMPRRRPIGKSQTERSPFRPASLACWPRPANLPITSYGSNFAPARTNSGVFLRTPAVPTDPARDCYELNIADPETSPFFTGSFVGRQKATEYLHSDDWQSFEVTAQRGHFVVKVDGRQVLDYTDPAPLGRGRIGLQLNKGAVAFRNIKLKPLGLELIFNGRDLAGWKVFPGKKSVFSVTPDGDLNVKKGNGQLETNDNGAISFCSWTFSRTANI